jgi:hypothetical protein
MAENHLYEVFPKTQIKPYDGMPVTADIWAMAHQEHRQARQAHDLAFHGAGVIHGLEVVANDPPDQYVFILPGVAVDPAGNVIVLTEPIAYDFGSATEGPLYLLLGSGEREISDPQNEVRQLQKEYVIAARTNLPKKPVVELARVLLMKRGHPIHNPADLAHPGVEEIDMRYRVQVGPDPRRPVKVAVCPQGNPMPAAMLSGWDYLAQECRRSSPYQLIVDSDLPLTTDLLRYDMIYLPVSGMTTLDGSGARSLKAAIDSGRALLVEALDEEAQQAVQPLWVDLGVSLSPVEGDHPLLQAPFLFNAPPEGRRAGSVQSCNQVVYSNAGYSLAWSGKVAGRGGRAEIRSAQEWGVNLVHYCVQWFDLLNRGG